MTNGYSGTPLAQKLGYKDGQRVLFVDLPAALDELRTLRQFAEAADAGWKDLAGKTFPYDLVHGFTALRSDLVAAASLLRRAIVSDGAIWISWPKRTSKVPTDITEDVLRELLLPTGLVDLKVAAIDATWSGLKFVIRRQLR